MAFIKYTHYSKVLGIESDVSIILPETESLSSAESIPEKYQTLYLLHGFSGTHHDWTRFSAIERYARDYNLAVIMPDAGKSFYTDMAYGDRYWEYISDELPRVMMKTFPLSDERADTFVAGLSMGGYGAFKLALKNPQRFSAAVSLSGVLDIEALVKRCEKNPQLIHECHFNTIFKDLVVPSDENLFNLISSRTEDIPTLQMYCGDQDFLLEDNYRFKRALEKAGVECEFYVDEGNHNWAYWDNTIKKCLEWLPLTRIV